MIGERLRVIIWATERFDPLRRPAMLLRPFSSRDLPVGDVTNKEVEEGELTTRPRPKTCGLAGRTLAAEGVERRFRLSAGTAINDPAEPEHLAQHRRVLKERLLLARQPVEPRRDHSLNSFRYRQVSSAGFLEQHPRVLLGIERVPARAGKEICLRLRRKQRSLKEAGEQAACVGLGERCERERRRV